MEKEELKNEVRDCIIKNQNAMTILKDGKQILAYNKLLGLNQKLQSMYKKLSAQQALQVYDSQPSKVCATSQGKVVKYGKA